MLTITGLAVVAVALSLLLKQKHPEFSLMISLLTGVLILGMILTLGIPVFERIGALLQRTGAQDETIEILFKSLGVCFVTQIACDACRDLGESAVASKVETAGKISVLLLALPLFERILLVANSLIG